MNLERSLLEKWRLFPREKQQEVLDFVESIEQNMRKSKHVNAAIASESQTRLSINCEASVSERHQILAPYIERSC